MKIVPLCAILVFIMYGCNNRNEELQQQNAALQNANTQLSRDIAARDEYVNNVTNTINEVYASIENLKAREASLLKEKGDMESKKKLTQEQINAKLIDRISLIRATLSNDHKRLKELQAKLSSSKKQFAGLQQMVDNLTKTLEERDQSIAGLVNQVKGLEKDITEKTELISKKDSVIGTQYRQIVTAYYISGTRDQLSKMGIIKKEGGFLWGLIGSTTTLASGFDDKYFKPIDKTTELEIQVNGKIDEIIPRRNEQFYRKTDLGADQSTLTIAEPDNFWKDKYLVIITDKPGVN